MRALYWTIIALLGLGSLSIGQTVTTPPSAALACAYSSSPPSPVSGQFYFVQCDSTGHLITSSSGGGSGTVTSVGWTGGIVSVATPTTTPAFTIAGTSGGIPYFASTSTWASSSLLTANAIMIGGGAATAPSTTTTGAGVLTALGDAPNTTGGFVTFGTTQPAPLTIGTSGSITGSYGYYVCTSTCSITLPAPAAGDQFCIRNDSAATTVITIAAITSVQFERTTFNGYGTATTGTMVSGGALGDKICLVGRDATHYLVGTYIGTWTNS